MTVYRIMDEKKHVRFQSPTIPQDISNEKNIQGIFIIIIFMKGNTYRCFLRKLPILCQNLDITRLHIDSTSVFIIWANFPCSSKYMANFLHFGHIESFSQYHFF